MEKNILIAPVVTEKAADSQSKGKYTVRVRSEANKVMIAKAIEKTYGVKVKSVNIVPVRQKTRLVGRGREITKRPAFKKAMITLAPKQTIDFNKVKTSSK